MSSLCPRPHKSGELLANRTEQESRRFSVRLGATSVIGALNAVVLEQGEMRWEVRDQAKIAMGQRDRMIWLYTFDGSGLGTTTKTYKQ